MMAVWAIVDSSSGLPVLWPVVVSHHGRCTKPARRGKAFRGQGAAVREAGLFRKQMIVNLHFHS